jgi:uncharacterized membrane protein YgcG
MSKQMNWRWGVVLLAAGALGGCYSQVRISPDYGVAVRQNAVAQIADPDAHYVGTPQPGSAPERVALAQRRYVQGRVIQPASTGTSSVTSGGGGGGDNGGGGGGNGGGGGAPAGP